MRAIQPVKQLVLRRLLLPALRGALATRPGVALLNRVHYRLPLGEKRRFYFLGSKERCRVDSTWTVAFAGRDLRLPLHRDFESAWLLALAFDGHDTEIHQFYASLIRSARPPRVVFDIGASYGLHSLRFLAAGVRTISFEPNPACHAYLRECGVLNAVRPEIEGMALSDKAGSAVLAIPSQETFLGTIVPDVAARLGARPDLTTITVPTISVDEFVAERGVVPDLVKIDAEGAEIPVLKGARRTLDTAHPVVVFESWRGSPDRRSLFPIFEASSYAIHALTYPYRETPPLSFAEFLDVWTINFVARSRRRDGG